MTNQSLVEYLQNTRERLADAGTRLDELEAKRAKIGHEIDRLVRERQGYQLLLDTLGEESPEVKSEQIETELEPESNELTGPGMILSSGAIGRRGEDMPQRRAEFARMTLRKAISGLVSDEPHHADYFANLIWALATQDDLRLAKRSLNSELSRMHRDGLLVKTGRNEFKKLANQGGVQSG